MIRNGAYLDYDYLDYDDIDGCGPEHYISPTVFLGTNYQILVDMFSHDQDIEVDMISTG